LLYYTLENPEGVSGYHIWVSGILRFAPETISVFPHLNWDGVQYIDMAMTTAQTLYICEYYTKSNNVGMQDLEIQLWSHDDNEMKGNAKLNTTEAGEPRGFILSDGNILLSPIAMQINAAAFGTDLHDSQFAYVSFVYADGSEYLIKDSAASILNQCYAFIEGNHLTIMFNRIVDINSLSEIVLDDLVISVGN